jgi:hypothetical protein
MAIVESDPFPAPPTGQLAMTVYARGQNLALPTKLEPGSELRLVVKGERDGTPYRQPANVDVAEMQRPNNDWGKPFAMYVPSLPLQSRGQLQIRFELTGAGDVWLDDVKLESLLYPLKFYPKSNAECFQLLQQIRPAKSAFDAGRITDCIRILDSYWPRFVLANRPAIPLKVAERIPPASPPQPDQGQEPSPGFGDRLKRLWPITR